MYPIDGAERADLNLTPTGRLSAARVAAMADEQLAVALKREDLAAGSLRLVRAEMVRRGVGGAWRP